MPADLLRRDFAETLTVSLGDAYSSNHAHPRPINRRPATGGHIREHIPGFHPGGDQGVQLQPCALHGRAHPRVPQQPHPPILPHQPHPRQHERQSAMR